MFNTVLAATLTIAGVSQSEPLPPGQMVNLGGPHVHIHCTGHGKPTVVVENGFDEFSTDWTMVQERVQLSTRICTYDRAGYAWSDPGRKPRTFAQINLELRRALQRLHEKGPFVLVGHSFGGPVVRNFAALYPRDVVGMVLVDSVEENQRVIIQGKAVQLRGFALGKAIPEPSLKSSAVEPGVTREAEASRRTTLSPPLDKLPPLGQRQHLWAQDRAAQHDAADSKRAWSPEYFARWASQSQEGSLGSLPLIVLTRADGGYGAGLDMPASVLETERLEGQQRLARLSTQAQQRLLASGHDMQLDAPELVAAAIMDVVSAARLIRK